LAEIIPISTDIDDMIANDGSRKLLLEQAIKEGFVPLQRLGIERVIAGEISLQDLAKSVDLSRNAGLIINEAEVLA
jgi:type II secretory ATPase GspE/PulE/Tfp pilus assembly ATPase PilB-like protein